MLGKFIGQIDSLLAKDVLNNTSASCCLNILCQIWIVEFQISGCADLPAVNPTSELSDVSPRAERA
jgi:hypothetical protein